MQIKRRRERQTDRRTSLSLKAPKLFPLRRTGGLKHHYLYAEPICELFLVFYALSVTNFWVLIIHKQLILVMLLLVGLSVRHRDTCIAVHRL